MYPIRRFILTLMYARTQAPLTIQQVCETPFRCMPWDIDMFMEMNNGRILTLFDLGRFDFAARFGLAKALKQHKWGLVVAGSTVRYRKRIRMFDRVTMRTQAAGYDERWMYIHQSMWVKGEPACSVLLRTGITEKGRTIPTERVLNALGIADLDLQLEPWEQAWIDADNQRPWPPK